MDIERIVLVHKHANTTLIFRHKEKKYHFIRFTMITHTNDFHNADIATTQNQKQSA